MRVRVTKRGSEWPEWVKRKMGEGQTFISQGSEYNVHAIVVFSGRVLWQIIDDIQMIGWYPSWFFEVIDSEVPNDWVCMTTDDQVQLVIGPDFVAGSEGDYARMVELDPHSVELFWKRAGSRGG